MSHSLTKRRTFILLALLPALWLGIRPPLYWDTKWIPFPVGWDWIWSDTAAQYAIDWALISVLLIAWAILLSIAYGIWSLLEASRRVS